MALFSCRLMRNYPIVWSFGHAPPRRHQAVPLPISSCQIDQLDNKLTRHVRPPREQVFRTTRSLPEGTYFFRSETAIDRKFSIWKTANAGRCGAFAEEAGNIDSIVRSQRDPVLEYAEKIFSSLVFPIPPNSDNLELTYSQVLKSYSVTVSSITSRTVRIFERSGPCSRRVGHNQTKVGTVSGKMRDSSANPCEYLSLTNMSRPKGRGSANVFI